MHTHTHTRQFQIPLAALDVLPVPVISTSAPTTRANMTTVPTPVTKVLGISESTVPALLLCIRRSSKDRYSKDSLISLLPEFSPLIVRSDMSKPIKATKAALRPTETAMRPASVDDPVGVGHGIGGMHAWLVLLAGARRLAPTSLWEPCQFGCCGESARDADNGEVCIQTLT